MEVFSRFEKFKYCHQKFLDYNLSEEELDNLGKQFSNLVFDSIVQSPLTLGIRDFIVKYHKTLRFSIISGTPTGELQQICHKLNLTSFFHEICGSPILKSEWCYKIIQANDLRKNETLFIGDAMTDYTTAQEVRIQFLLRDTHLNKDQFNNYQGLRDKRFY